ncbi:glycosyltransferase family 4 protein [Patescibacteria group bacterium]|nr:glycosyltransferase family 4 protein [Patescibacteria group bacterium]
MEAKKKILVFIPEFPVLTETFIERELAKLAERRNVDIRIFSLQEGKGEISEVLRDRIYYQRLKLQDIPKELIFFIRNFSDIYNSFLGFHKAQKINKKNENEINNPCFFKSLYIFLKSCAYAEKFSHFKPDLILAHFFSEPSTITMFISKILKIPYGISAHAKDILVTSQYPREKVKSSKFITICNENAYKFVIDTAKGLDTSNIYLAYHGVDLQRIYQSVENKDHRPEKPLILAVGRLVGKKGLEYLIEAGNILKERNLDFCISIIGSGPLYNELTEKIENLNLQDSVKILGSNKGLSNEDTLVHFKSASVFAFPSIETNEGDVDGVANVLLEAGIFKLPVVSTDAGGTGELIINEETGLVVPQRESQDFADKLELVLKNRELSERLGLNLYNKVLDKFSLDRNISQLENMLLKDY